MAKVKRIVSPPPLPFSYRLLRNRRRRHLALLVNEQGEIEARAPLRMAEREIIHQLHLHADWLVRRQDEIRQRAATRPRLVPGSTLPLLDRELTIRLVDQPRRLLTHQVEEGLIELKPADADHPIEQQIEQWYRQLAPDLLGERLAGLAVSMGRAPQKVVIRSQRRRWGSCSSRGTISLNWRILLLPTDLADYILVHELAHLHHLNHSPAFWSLVEHYLPDYRQRQRALQQVVLPL